MPTELRPRTASELIDATFQLTRAHYVPLLVLSAIMGAPALVIGVAAGGVIRAMSTPAIASTATTGEKVATFGALALSTLWYFVIDGALVWFAARAYLDREADPAAALREAFSRAGRLIGSNLLRFLYIVLGALVPVIAIGAAAALVGNAAKPAMAGRTGPLILIGVLSIVGLVLLLGWFLFVFARYIALAPILMLEDRGPVAALSRSAELMKGGRRRAAAMLVLAFVVYLALSTMAAAPFGLMKSTVTSQLVRSLVQILLYPLFASLVALLYYDQRVRKEAFDIELMTGSLGGLPGADAA